MSLDKLVEKLKGGPGSGFHGHSGRKGKRGGSSGSSGGGNSVNWEKNFFGLEAKQGSSKASITKSKFDEGIYNLHMSKSGVQYVPLIGTKLEFPSEDVAKNVAAEFLSGNYSDFKFVPYQVSLDVLRNVPGTSGTPEHNKAVMDYVKSHYTK